MKIIQYLPYPVALEVLSSRGTFRLKSLRYFLSLKEESDGVGDNMELKAFFDEGGSGQWVSSAIVSCWTIADDQENPQPDWSKLGGREIAILSSIDSVVHYLEEHIDGLLDKSWFLSHDKVNYYETFSRDDFRTRDIVFWKRKKFSSQNEYRFSFRRSCIGAHLETFIFTNKYLDTFPSYIDRVFVNPALTNEKYQKLLLPWLGDRNKAMSKFPDWERAYRAQQNGTHNSGSCAASM
jgi:hypothetical protein